MPDSLFPYSHLTKLTMRYVTFKMCLFLNIEMNDKIFKHRLVIKFLTLQCVSFFEKRTKT